MLSTLAECIYPLTRCCLLNPLREPDLLSPRLWLTSLFCTLMGSEKIPCSDDPRIVTARDLFAPVARGEFLPMLVFPRRRHGGRTSGVGRAEPPASEQHPCIGGCYASVLCLLCPISSVAQLSMVLRYRADASVGLGIALLPDHGVADEHPAAGFAKQLQCTLTDACRRV